MRTYSTWATTGEPRERWEGESVDTRLHSRLGQSAPYFALEDCRFNGAELRAVAGSETDPGDELGTASCAEIARHALMTGAACLALTSPVETRSFYLVSSIDGTFFTGTAPFGTPIHYAAVASAQGPVGGSAQIEARLARELVARLRVSFAVVEETLFERLFSTRRTTTFGDMGGYLEYEPFASCSYDSHAADGRLVVERSGCCGHFHQYPTLPVTTLLGQLVRLGSALVPGPFRVSALKLRAPALAWAGDEVALHIEKSGGPWNLSGRASVSGRTVTSLDLAVVGGFPRA